MLQNKNHLIANISLLLFYWYYITCFCAVYKNTQSNLLKDTMISFALSMLYPFGICVGAAIIRIMALRCKSKCLFWISKLL